METGSINCSAFSAISFMSFETSLEITSFLGASAIVPPSASVEIIAITSPT